MNLDNEKPQNIKDYSIKMLADLLRSLEEREKVRASYELLARLDPASLRILIFALGNETAAVVNNAVKALIGIGEPAVEFLVLTSQKGDDKRREMAIESLKRLDSIRFKDVFIKAVTDPFPGVRRRVLGILADYEDPDLYPLFRNAIKDEDDLVRTVAVEGLVQSNRREVVELLLPLLNDSSSKVRGSVAYKIAKYKDKRAVKSLINILKKGKLLERSNSAYALGEIRDESVIPLLIDTLKSDSRMVKNATMFALRKFGRKAVKSINQARKRVDIEKDKEYYFDLTAIYWFNRFPILEKIVVSIKGLNKEKKGINGKEEQKEAPSVFRILRSDLGAYNFIIVPIITLFAYLSKLFQDWSRSGFSGTDLISLVIVFFVSSLGVIWRIYWVSTIFDYGVEVPGQVEFISFRSGRGRVFFNYQYQGKDLKGKRMIKRNKYTMRISPGENVTVVVNQKNPKNAVIKQIFIGEIQSNKEKSEFFK